MNRIYTSLIVIIAVFAAWLGNKFWNGSGAEAGSAAPIVEQAAPAQPNQPNPPVTQEPPPAPPAVNPESGSPKKFNF